MSNFLKILLILGASVAIGLLIGTQGVRGVFTLLGIAGIAALGLVILTKPFVGVIATLVTMPLESILPDVPLGTSVISFIGLLTLGAYLVSKRFAITSNTGLSWVYRFAIIFIVWLFASNPSAALTGDRNWLFTYFQLIVLAWLSAEELVQPQRQRLLMLAFLITTAISAVPSFSQANLTNTIYRSTRADGLVDNANQFAMYLNVAIAFTIYFIVSPDTKRWLRLPLVGALVILILGVVLSISRSGAFALGSVLVAGLFLYPKLSASSVGQNPTRNIIALLFVVATIVAIASLLIPDQYWRILEEARQLVEQGDDATRGTFVVRLELWQEAVDYWRTSPIVGIGAGRFNELSGHVTHNMYFQVLAEQGLIGIIFLFGLLGSIIFNLWRSMVGAHENKTYVALAAAWMLALLPILVMGLSGSWQVYSKMLWSLAGISTVFIIPFMKKAVANTGEPSPQLITTKV